MNVLVACEESQAVCKAFRKRGHNAYSCDILECSGGHPEWHFHQDVLSVIADRGGRLENGLDYYLEDGQNWDLMIAHPPCTYLSVSGARWLYHPDDAHLPVEQRREHPHHIGRRQQQKDAIEFFMEFTKTVEVSEIQKKYESFSELAGSIESYNGSIRSTVEDLEVINKRIDSELTEINSLISSLTEYKNQFTSMKAENEKVITGLTAVFANLDESEKE